MKKELTDSLLTLVREGYDNIASDFDLTRKKKLWPELAKLAAGVETGKNVLDAGCGNGRLLEAFFDKKINYLGFDNSQKLIAIAQQNYPGRDFIIGDILKNDQSLISRFDYVFCVAVLAHIPSQDLQRQALENLRSYLRPNGRAIISVWNLRRNLKFKMMIIKNLILKFLGQRFLPAADLVFPWQDKNRAKRYYHAFTSRKLRSLIAKTGFKMEKMYKDKYNYWLILK